MKIYSLILIAFLTLSTQAFGQWNGFDIYISPGQWYGKSQAYATQANFKKNVKVLTQSGITKGGHNGIAMSPELVRGYLEKHFPDVNSEGIVVLDWESEIYKWIRDYPETDPNFRYAESQWIALINEVRKVRPNLKVGIYGMPYRGFNDWQKDTYNKPGALDNIMSKVDIIMPSLYIGYSDEERSREYNLGYLKDMLDIAMTYGRRHNKPVMPFVWHRVLRSNKIYPRGIIQTNTYATYVKFIKDYSFNGHKVCGVYLWDDGFHAPRLENLEGVAKWLKGKVKDAASYDAMCVSQMKSIVNKLND